MSKTEANVAKGLLPCPFCGGAPTVRSVDDGDIWWRIECSVCECRTEFQRSPHDAREVWNRRTGGAGVGEASLETLERQVRNLSMGMRRLIAYPKSRDSILESMRDYMQREGLNGSPLREEDAAPVRRESEAERVRWMQDCLLKIEAHHIEQNALVGRDTERSKTLALVRAALAEDIAQARASLSAPRSLEGTDG